ncbi:hypothetical protein RZS08_33930, partial [Arthrospira platensis SPKY1]|nr:hypothetical protein [Arthrospira platensis SPKY1]
GRYVAPEIDDDSGCLGRHRDGAVTQPDQRAARQGLRRGPAQMRQKLLRLESPQRHIQRRQCGRRTRHPHPRALTTGLAQQATGEGHRVGHAAVEVHGHRHAAAAQVANPGMRLSAPAPTANAP